MDLVICGDGRLGWAIAEAAHTRGDRARVLGRPGTDGHDPASLAGASVLIDASSGDAVADNLAAGIAAGIRRFVLATTGWDAAGPAVDDLVRRSGSVAVRTPNLSLGAAVFVRLVEQAAAGLATHLDYEPFIWEWHRQGKTDRPSGTARELARVVGGAVPGRPAPEVAVVRAGSSPGVHVVGFDAPGETIELRLAARDRTAYAAGALAAVDWLALDQPVGIHPFDLVVDDLLVPRPRPAVA